MQEPSLQAQLLESKAEITRLRERLSIGTPKVHKDLSLISLVPKWSGSDSAVSLEEFVESIESAAKIGRWDSADYANCSLETHRQLERFIVHI